MRYARTLLNRGNAPSFGVVKNMFGGNLMRQEIVETEVVTGKGQGKGTIGGAGETQLQIEQYNLKIREGKLNSILKSLQTKGKHQNIKRENNHKT
jgi:hypothetical protein